YRCACTLERRSIQPVLRRLGIANFDAAPERRNQSIFRGTWSLEFVWRLEFGLSEVSLLWFIMFFIGLGTAAPAQRYSQRECWETLLNSPEIHQLTSRSQAIVKKVLLGDNGIVTRHLALDRVSAAFELNPDTLHTRFLKHAPTLAT